MLRAAQALISRCYTTRDRKTHYKIKPITSIGGNVTLNPVESGTFASTMPVSRPSWSYRQRSTLPLHVGPKRENLSQVLTTSTFYQPL